VKRHDTELDIHIYTHNLTADILYTTTAQGAIQNTQCRSCGKKWQ